MVEKLVQNIKQYIVVELLDFSDWLREELTRTKDYLYKNKLLIKLTKTQKLLNKLFTIQKDIQKLENDNINKTDLETYNILLVEQQALKDYITYITSLLGKWDIPKTEYIEYTKKLKDLILNKKEQ